MFRILPRNAELNELWEANLLYSRATDAPEPREWRVDAYDEDTDYPTDSAEEWEYALQVED